VKTKVWCYICHWWKQMHPTLEVENNIVIMGKLKFEFMGLLLFSLCFHVVRVPNCMTTSTIAHAWGDFAIWEANFRALKFFVWQEINRLCINDVEIQQLPKNSIMEDDKWATLFWTHVGTLIPKPTFRMRIEEMMKIMISKTLFQDYAIVGHALLKDF